MTDECDGCTNDIGKGILIPRLVSLQVDGRSVATALRYNLCDGCLPRFDDMMRLSKFSLLLMRALKDDK